MGKSRWIISKILNLQVPLNFTGLKKWPNPLCESPVLSTCLKMMQSLCLIFSLPSLATSSGPRAESLTTQPHCGSAGIDKREKGQ